MYAIIPILQMRKPIWVILQLNFSYQWRAELDFESPDPPLHNNIPVKQKLQVILKLSQLKPDFQCSNRIQLWRWKRWLEHFYLLYPPTSKVKKLLQKPSEENQTRVNLCFILKKLYSYTWTTKIISMYFKNKKSMSNHIWQKCNKTKSSCTKLKTKRKFHLEIKDTLLTTPEWKYIE